MQYTQEDLRLLYFVHMESHDAKLIRLRDQQWGGQTNRVVEELQKRLKHPMAHTENIQADIERFRHIGELEKDLRDANLTDGDQPIDVSYLVNRFEHERKDIPLLTRLLRS